MELFVVVERVVQIICRGIILQTFDRLSISASDVSPPKLTRNIQTAATSLLPGPWDSAQDVYIVS